MSSHRTAPTGTQHVVDIENLLRGRVTSDRVRAAFAEYRALVPIGPDDDVVVGLGRERGTAAFDVPAPARVRIGAAGPDGADHALLDAVDPVFSARRYERVVLATGDGIFQPMARALRDAGAHVVLVFVPMHVNAALYSTAHDSVRFPDLAVAA